ncbi:fimbrial protein [Enterobacter quasiroggenkampii]|uniref:fimbrial protein n=1 Tax=Enterobacter quasiroggenkampii TaxID=2497436 RepID=UPI0021CDF82F|nr:fimbrial protein [Enterobacter quasiroggenkampii]MCU6276756.1 fimbrial protein [Enterobacter quasiroggenkampii]MCU6307288.1 fimbrial protein [Enterobacter quasiroggenkampii]MCU6330427.1 fimbrial protein [Enterobacter quasiroggenkampii]MCU6336481.1 fimbrial protein [Enterobacter quasiroggenkampii]MCU6385303.1 fimbrial protein [Enterobacter quasiroggenkampii]
MKMHKTITGCLNTLFFVGLTAAACLGYQGQARAAQECRFGDGSGGTTTLANSLYDTPIRWYPKSNGSMWLLASFDMDLSPGLTSHCGMGNDGRQLAYKNASGNTRGRGPQPDGGMGNYYVTNIPGVYFSVKIFSSAGGGYFGDGNADGWTNLVDDPGSNIWDGKTWKAHVNVFQDTAEFYSLYGNTSQATFISPGGSYSLGQMTLGDPSDSNNQPWTFNVTPSSFQVPIMASTCEHAQLDSGSNTVALGEYMLSDFNASPVSHPFRVQLTGCNNVYSVKFKMTASKLTGPDNSLLGNMLNNGAEGVGVKVLGDHNRGFFEQIKPDEESGVLFSPDTNPGTSLGLMNFEAQLVKDGNPLKAGNFTAMTTFQITYY